MPRIRTAVIGAGYLGRFHAQKYAALPQVDLLAVVDTDAEARDRVAREVGCEAVADYRSLLGKVDAVSVVTPTPLHHRVSMDFLEAGAHVLVEKPITSTMDEARELVATAARRGRVLQVGHLERFNPAILAIEGLLDRPRFVESNRLAPFKPRGTDVSVVLDLMIHDIDLIQNIVNSPVESIDAVGAPVFTDEIDIANARIRFENGCVADATASRISMKSERKLRVFQADAYLSIDLQQKVLTMVRKGSGAPQAGVPPVEINEQSFDPGDALRDEIVSFLECIETGRRPVVSGEDGLQALETAIRIGELLGTGALAR
ncbi:MAG TPA: Gfo/Idh/MocA family oxidoreductase [Steroidobacteraceae bacterium]|nr:Gfo/Idh/MocA family oxidoreductase [Steroidobacteraceae bacterium]